MTKTMGNHRTLGKETPTAVQVQSTLHHCRWSRSSEGWRNGSSFRTKAFHLLSNFLRYTPQSHDPKQTTDELLQEHSLEARLVLLYGSTVSVGNQLAELQQSIGTTSYQIGEELEVCLLFLCLGTRFLVSRRLLSYIPCDVRIPML